MSVRTNTRRHDHPARPDLVTDWVYTCVRCKIKRGHTMIGGSRMVMCRDGRRRRLCPVCVTGERNERT